MFEFAFYECAKLRGNLKRGRSRHSQHCQMSANIKVDGKGDSRFCRERLRDIKVEVSKQLIHIQVELRANSKKREEEENLLRIISASPRPLAVLPGTQNSHVEMRGCFKPNSALV